MRDRLIIPTDRGTLGHYSPNPIDLGPFAQGREASWIDDPLGIGGLSASGPTAYGDAMQLTNRWVLITGASSGFGAAAAEAFARAIGCRKAVVYATPEAAGFYAAAGYNEDPFDDNYFGGVVQMAKPLHYAGYSMEADG